jgi:crotonobetainyl-CoA:carnitine CoA-transferase CaiB-like acyl-CoA transferase
MALTDSSTTVAEIKARVLAFARERDWEQFHAPKNLSMALAAEAGELMEHFLWATPEASRTIAQDAVKPNGDTQAFVGQPFALSRTPSKIVRTPPDIGQHTDEVLKEFGFADAEIAALHQAKAV